MGETFSYSLQTIIPSTELCVSVEDAKVHMRVDTDDEDTYIAGLINVSTTLIETFCRRTLLRKSLKLIHPTFPVSGDSIRLPSGPVVAPDEGYTNFSVKYIDQNGVLQTLSPTNYRLVLSHEPPMVILNPGFAWPYTQFGIPDGVQISYQAGWASAKEVPFTLKQAVLWFVAHYFDNRQQVVYGASHSQLQQIPNGIEALCAPYRLVEV